MLATLVLLYRPLLFASTDPDVALARGVPVRALTLVFGVLIGLADGPPEPWSIGALVLALVSQLLSAVMTVLLVVLVTRLYVQLTTRDDELGAVFNVPDAP